MFCCWCRNIMLCNSSDISIFTVKYHFNIFFIYLLNLRCIYSALLCFYIIICSCRLACVFFITNFVFINEIVFYSKIHTVLVVLNLCYMFMCLYAMYIYRFCVSVYKYIIYCSVKPLKQPV